MSQRWTLSHKFDPRALPLADRHYNRRKVGSPQFVPPGRALVLLTPDADALWTTSWPFAEFVRHDWPGAWVNSCFRNESEFRGASPKKFEAAFRRPRPSRRSHWVGAAQSRGGQDAPSTCDQRLVAQRLFPDQPKDRVPEEVGGSRGC